MGGEDEDVTAGEAWGGEVFDYPVVAERYVMDGVGPVEGVGERGGVITVWGRRV